MSEVFTHKRRTLDRLTKRQQAVREANRKAAEQAKEMAERERRAHEVELERAGEWLKAAREEAGRRTG